jgi:hypothetical protein
MILSIFSTELCSLEGTTNFSNKMTGINLKKRRMKKQTPITMRLILTFLMVMTTGFTFGQANNEKMPPVIPIKEAISKGMLQLKISGAADPRLYYEVVDRDGVHFGKCMAIILKSNIDSFILLKLESGTELIPFDSSFQTMIVTKTVELPLYPGRTYVTRFYAMCGQLHDNAPYLAATYKVGNLADSITVKLAQYFDKKFIQSMIGQHALWAYTDNADFKELKKYGADSLSIALSASFLNDLSIETPLNPKKHTKESSAEETFQISKLLFYKAILLITVLFLILTFLIFKNRKSNETTAS